MNKATKERFSKFVLISTILSLLRNFYISFGLFVGYRAWTNTSDAFYIVNMLPLSSIILIIGYILCRLSYAQQFYSKERLIVPNKKFYVSFWKLILFIDSLLLGLAAVPWIKAELGREPKKVLFWYAVLIVYTMVCLFLYVYSIKKAYRNKANGLPDEVGQ